jgi:hypothetical protein
MCRDNTRLKLQPMYLFRQAPSKVFFEISQQAAPVLAKSVGCGGAQADYEAEGKMDIAAMAHPASTILAPQDLKP